MEFSRQEYWSGLPLSSRGDLPDPVIEPGSPALQAHSLLSAHWGNPMKSCSGFNLTPATVWVGEASWCPAPQPLPHQNTHSPLTSWLPFCGHSKSKENDSRPSRRGYDSWGCIFFISVSPEGSGTGHLFNISSCGTELCSFSVSWVTQVFPSHYHFPHFFEHVNKTPPRPHVESERWTISSLILYLSKQRFREGGWSFSCPAWEGSGSTFCPVGGRSHLSGMGVQSPPPNPLWALPLYPLLWSPS